MKFLSTGIGGVPMDNWDQAWELSLKFDWPFRPERSSSFAQESLVGQLEHWPQRCFPEIPEQVAEKLKHKKLAIHYPGPDVLDFLSTEQSLGFDSYLERLQLRLAQDLVEYAKYEIEVIAFFDMPNLMDWVASSPAQFFQWKEHLKKLKNEHQLKVGIHCCHQFKVDVVDSLETQFFSFDFLSAVDRAPDLSESLIALDHSTQLIFGVIDVRGKTVTKSGKKKLEEIAETRGLGKVWISPTCSLVGALDVFHILHFLQNFDTQEF